MESRILCRWCKEVREHASKRTQGVRCTKRLEAKEQMRTFRSGEKKSGKLWDLNDGIKEDHVVLEELRDIGVAPAAKRRRFMSNTIA